MTDPPTPRAVADLLAAIERVLSALAERLGAGGQEAPREQELGARTATGTTAPGTLTHVARAFGLDPFATDLVVLLAAMDLDPRAPALVAAALGRSGQTVAPTFGLALAALSEPRWDALTPTSPLRAFRLVDVGPGPLTAAPLHLDERVLHALCGADTLDARLAARLQPVPGHPSAPPSLVPAAAAIAAAATAGLGVQVVGGDHTDRLAVVGAALGGASLGGRGGQADPSWSPEPPRTWRCLASEVPRTVEEQDAFARLWDREVRLGGARLVLDADDETDPGVLGAVRRITERLTGPVVLTGRWPLEGGPDVVVSVPRLSAADQRALWRGGLTAALGPGARACADHLVDRFDLGWQPIERAAALVAGESASGPSGLSGPSGQDVLDDGAARARCVAAVHAVTRPTLEGLAQQITPTATRERLALPAASLAVLDDMVRHVRQRRRVHDDWGFDGTRGRGLAALFTGPSGTGKTLAAEVVASELGLELWRVDLSVVVSKYIGETEKQLRRVLDAAEAGTVVLLFDEADALFGKRTELRDSHDRYANQEVAYLLQRLETFRGVAVLTTNLRAAIDEAFLRRFRFVLPFPFPDAEQRREIWEAVVPEQAPFAPVDTAHLARLGLTGGHLHSVALAAAVLAADDGGVVTGEHLRRAVRQEYLKLGRTLTSAEDAALVAATRAAPGRPVGASGGQPPGRLPSRGDP